MKIAVLGLWHLGEIYSAGLAELGHIVYGVSEDEKVISGFKKNIPPLAEPGLTALLKKHQKSGALSYTADFSVMGMCDVLWFTFDTPVTEKDKAQTKIIFDSLKKALPHLRNNVLIIVSSQLPVGSSRELTTFIKKKRPGLSFSYAYIPENLRLGEAVSSFFKPERIVVGTDDVKTFQKIREMFRWIRPIRQTQGGQAHHRRIRADFLHMSPVSAEMVKHALNSFLAVSLSFIYDIADICESVGADILDVSQALKLDSRIGEKAYLDASVGFSGGTLGRDLQFLLSEGKNRHLPLPVIAGAFKKNKGRKQIVYQFLKLKLGTIKNKTIVIAGLAYKAGTTTLRRSLALEVADNLYKQGARILFYDEMITEKDIKNTISFPFVYKKNFLDAIREASACVIITPWTDLKKIHFARMRTAMKKPAILFDARNFLACEVPKIKSAGLYYKGVGRGNI